MRPHYSIGDIEDGDTLIGRRGQVELWETSNHRFGVYLWVVRPNEPDDKLCTFRVDRGDAEEVFDRLCDQIIP